MWLGDQLTSWGGGDGLLSVVIGAMTAGLSGWSMQHGDLGGFTMIQLPPNRTRCGFPPLGAAATVVGGWDVPVLAVPLAPGVAPELVVAGLGRRYGGTHSQVHE